VNVLWDQEVKVWIAGSDDVARLAAGADAVWRTEGKATGRGPRNGENNIPFEP
jgi:Domain of unknown function (DUF1902)